MKKTIVTSTADDPREPMTLAELEAFTNLALEKAGSDDLANYYVEVRTTWRGHMRHIKIMTTLDEN